MNFSRTIKRLERKEIISKEPNPALPFILAFVALALGIIVFYIDMNRFLGYAIFSLAGFTFIFAILHFIVVEILES